MSKTPKTPNRFVDTPRDKPVTERTEHANHDRPGAKAHPVARGWTHLADPIMAWRMR
jgi:hypothetical protein